MKPKLPILPIIVITLWISSLNTGQGGAPEIAQPDAVDPRHEQITRPPVVSSQGDALVAAAISALERQRSIAARIRLRVDIYDQQLVGSGSYLQGPPESRWMRWEARIQVADQVSSLQQVCDGHSLWIHRELLGKTTLARVDVESVLSALQHAGETTGVATEASVNRLGLGGLPRLLRSLDHAFRFATPQSAQVGGKALLVVRGEWMPEQLCQLLPEQEDALRAGKRADLSELRDQTPDHVMLYFGRDDLVPYRIEYRRSQPTKYAESQRRRTLLAIELMEVQLGVPLDARQFAYNPGDLDVRDETSRFLRDMGLDDVKPAESEARRHRRGYQVLR